MHSFVSKRAAAQNLNFFFFGILALGLKAFLGLLRASDRQAASYLIFFAAIFMFFVNFLVGLVFVLDLKNFFAYLFIFFLKRPS